MNFYNNKFLKQLSITLVFLFMSVSLPVSSNATPWLFLKNISGVGIFIENLSRDKATTNLNTESLYLNVEDILQKSNIKVYEGSQWQNYWGGSFIKIKIISSKFQGSDNFAVYIDTSVYRPVVIFGGTVNQNKSFNSSSWSTGKLFSCSQEELQTCVQKGMNDLIELFISDFKAVNGE